MSLLMAASPAAPHGTFNKVPVLFLQSAEGGVDSASDPTRDSGGLGLAVGIPRQGSDKLDADRSLHGDDLACTAHCTSIPWKTSRRGGRYVGSG